jgi:Porin subfamily
MMKMVKSLLLGTAAGIITVAGAQAADMPVKANPVQYVKICTLYGDGYYYIPGSDTCIRIGGYVRVEAGWNVAGGGAQAYSSTQGAQDRTVSAASSRVRADIAMDTRTQTQYGTLRTLTSLFFQNQNQSESFNVGRAFIQWAGFSFGRMESFSDTWALNDSWDMIQWQTGSDTSSIGVNSIAYTFEFGNGVTVNVGVDERRTKALTNLSVNSALKVGADPTDYHQGEVYPDPFINLRVNQAWGWLSVSGGVHDVNASYYTQSGTSGSLATSGVPGYSCTAAGFAGGVGAANTPLSSCGHPSDKVGFFVMGGGELKLPQFGPGDRVGAGVRYSQGASSYGAGLNLASPDLFSGGNNLALGWMTDGVFVNGSGIELTTAWGVSAGYEHHWNPTLYSSVFAGYSAISYDTTAQTYFSDALGCTATGSGAAVQTSVNNHGTGATNCNPNWQFLEAGYRTTWQPAAGFYFSLETLYTYVWTGFGGDTLSLTNAGANPVVGARASGFYSLANQGIWSELFRVQRTFNAD